MCTQIFTKMRKIKLESSTQCRQQNRVLHIGNAVTNKMRFALRWMALVLVLIGGGVNSVKAETGASQPQAFNIPIFRENPSTEDFNCTSSEIWFKFIPTDDKLLVTFTTYNSTINYNFNYCELYDNNAAIAGGTILATQNSLGMNLKNLTVGNTYYFKFSVHQSLVQTLSTINLPFSIGAVPPTCFPEGPANADEVCISTPPSCELVCNGYFEDYATGAMPDIPCTTAQLDKLTRWFNPTCGTPDYFYITDDLYDGCGNPNSPPSLVCGYDVNGAFYSGTPAQLLHYGYGDNSIAQTTSHTLGRGFMGLATWNDLE